jgi:hypothetical protein
MDCAIITTTAGDSKSVMRRTLLFGNWNNLELPLHHNHLCMDCCAPERTAAESVESALESVENHVLDDNRTRAVTGVGGQAILCCEGDKG